MSSRAKTLTLLAITLAFLWGSTGAATILFSGQISDSSGNPTSTYLMAAKPGSPFSNAFPGTWARLGQTASDENEGYELTLPGSYGDTLILGAKYGVDPYYLVLAPVEIQTPDATLTPPNPDLNPEISVTTNIQLPDFDADNLSLQLRILEGGIEVDYGARAYSITVMTTNVPANGRAVLVPGTSFLSHRNQVHDLPDGQYTVHCVLDDPQNPMAVQEKVITMTLPISGDPLTNPVDIPF